MDSEGADPSLLGSISFIKKDAMDGALNSNSQAMVKRNTGVRRTTTLYNKILEKNLETS
jgi:hypothetical protein